jgi:hypothetical protein
MPIYLALAAEIETLLLHTSLEFVVGNSASSGFIDVLDVAAADWAEAQEVSL